MEQKENDEIGVLATTSEAENESSSRSPVKTKRSARMLYESSFATSFTSVRGQKRPPGFVASSLDYRASGVSAAGPPTITTKPGRNSKYNKQQQQQGKSDSEQQQRQYRSGQSQPTRAQGNFGPPPHSIKTLEDLENMSEEQIYKLFMDDPELYETFIKTTEKGRSSVPAGARKARRSTGKKPSGDSKSKRSSIKSKTIKLEPVDREVPYFQWLFLLILVGVALYQAFKSFSTPDTSKDRNNTVATRKVRGGKQKKKKVTSEKKLNIKTKAVPRDKTKSSLPLQKKEDPAGTAKIVGKTSSSKNKRKKVSKSKPKAVVSANTGGENKEDRVSKQEPELDSSDVSSGDQEPEIVSQVESVASSDQATIPTIQEDLAQDWQTVTKSSKGAKKEMTTTTPSIVEETKIIAESAVEAEEDGASSSNESQKNEPDPVVENHTDESGFIEVKTNDSKKNELDPVEENPTDESGFIEVKTKKKSIASSNSEKDTTSGSQLTAGDINEAKPGISEDEKASEVKPSEKSDASKKGESAATTEDDAALAMQLHKEEINLARVVSGNPQEEAWEEVTTKKKKGIKA